MLLRIAHTIISVLFILVCLGLYEFWYVLPFKDYSAEAWAAVAAGGSVFVAIIALYTSLHQIDESKKAAEEAKKAAKLSVVPNCFFTTAGGNAEKHPVGIFLRNTGLGPAKVLEWSFFIKGVEIPEKNEQGFLRIIKEYSLQDYAHYYPLQVGAGLGANEKAGILYVPFEYFEYSVISEGKGAGKASVEAMMFLASEVNIKLRYANAYDDPFETDSNLSSMTQERS